MIGSSWPGLKVMQSNNLKTNFPSMAFRSLKAFQVWRFGRKLVSKYGISVAQNPDFTLKSENAELMPLELTKFAMYKPPFIVQTSTHRIMRQHKGRKWM